MPEFLFAKIISHLGRLFEKCPADVSGSNGAGEKAGRKLFAAAAGKSVPHVKKTVDSQTNKH